MGRRIFIMILIAAVLVLGGCSSKSEDQGNTDVTGTENTGKAATPQPTVQPTAEPVNNPTEKPVISPTESAAESVNDITEPTKDPTEQPTLEPTEQPTLEPTEQPTLEPTEQPTAQPTEEPTHQPTEEPTHQPTQEPTQQPVPTSAVNVPEDFYGYYKIIYISMNNTVLSKEYFDIFEKYGIFAATAFISADGYAEFSLAMDEEEPDRYSFDGTSFKRLSDGSEILYVYKDGILTTLEAEIVGNIKVDFVKMTEDEINRFKKGFTEEDFENAVGEANALYAKNAQNNNSEYLNYIEKARRADDALKYSELYELAQIALVTNDVIDMLNAGHSYRIIMEKERARLLVDGVDADEEDPVYKLIAGYVGNDFLSQYVIRGSNASEYIIDISSDMKITKTVSPDTDDEE